MTNDYSDVRHRPYDPPQGFVWQLVSTYSEITALPSSVLSLVLMTNAPALVLDWTVLDCRLWRCCASHELAPLLVTATELRYVLMFDYIFAWRWLTTADIFKIYSWLILVNFVRRGTSLFSRGTSPDWLQPSAATGTQMKCTFLDKGLPSTCVNTYSDTWCDCTSYCRISIKLGVASEWLPRLQGWIWLAIVHRVVSSETRTSVLYDIYTVFFIYNCPRACPIAICPSHLHASLRAS